MIAIADYRDYYNSSVNYFIVACFEVCCKMNLDRQCIVINHYFKKAVTIASDFDSERGRYHKGYFKNYTSLDFHLFDCYCSIVMSF